MGLDLICNGVFIKCGCLSKLRDSLIIALKDFIELEIEGDNEIDSEKKDRMVDYLIQLLDGKPPNHELEVLFHCHNMGGFFVFISKNSKYISYSQAKDFIKTYKLVKDYIPCDLKDVDGKFYMNAVFRESIHTMKSIQFH